MSAIASNVSTLELEQTIATNVAGILGA